MVSPWLFGGDCTVTIEFLSATILHTAGFSEGFQMDTVHKVTVVTGKKYIHQRKKSSHLLRAAKVNVVT